MVTSLVQNHASRIWFASIRFKHYGIGSCAWENEKNRQSGVCIL